MAVGAVQVGAAATLAISPGAAGTAAGEPAVGHLGAITEAGARVEGSAVGGNGHRAEGATEWLDLKGSSTVWYGVTTCIFLHTSTMICVLNNVANWPSLV